MALQFSGQDVDVVQAAKDAGAVMIKRRDTYIFVGFDSDADRTVFRTALSGIAQISHQNQPYSNMYVEKVTPAT